MKLFIISLALVMFSCERKDNIKEIKPDASVTTVDVGVSTDVGLKADMNHKQETP